MPSGVVFVAILVIWAVILAPRAMRLYERTATQRTTKRFSSAMSALGNGQAGSRVSVDTARKGPRLVLDHSARPWIPASAGGPQWGSGTALATTGCTSASAYRRRRVVVLCCAAVLIAVVAAAGGALPWIAVPIAGIPLVLFVGAYAATVSQRNRQQPVVGVTYAVDFPDGTAPAAMSMNGTGAASTAGDSGVVILSSRRARRSGLRAGNLTRARVLEAELAIAATYSSPEEQLGLDRFVASPLDVDGQPYLRAANE